MPKNQKSPEEQAIFNKYFLDFLASYIKLHPGVKRSSKEYSRAKNCAWVKAYNKVYKHKKSEADKKYKKKNKEKVNARCKAYQESHKEEIAIRKKAYRESHKEKIAIRDKSYYKANREKIAIRQKAYIESHKEEIAIRRKAYRESHKEEIAIRLKAYQESHKKEIAIRQKAYDKVNRVRKCIKKFQRIEAVNSLLETIGSCGRRFFHYKNGVSKFVISPNNRVAFWDSYTDKLFYPGNPRAKRIHEGGTLQSLLRCFHKYIMCKELLPSRIFGPWDQWYCGGDVWGYGEDNMEKIRVKAKELDIIAEKTVNGNS